MSQDAWDLYSTEPELQVVPVRMVGTGASAPTKIYGRDVTISRTGVGVYVLTFREFTGTFVGAYFALQATTVGNIKNLDVSFAPYNATTRSIEISVWSSAGAARELAALEWLNVTLLFQPRAAGI